MKDFKIFGYIVAVYATIYLITSLIEFIFYTFIY